MKLYVKNVGKQQKEIKYSMQENGKFCDDCTCHNAKSCIECKFGSNDREPVMDEIKVKLILIIQYNYLVIILSIYIDTGHMTRNIILFDKLKSEHRSKIEQATNLWECRFIHAEHRILDNGKNEKPTNDTAIFEKNGLTRRIRFKILPSYFRNNYNPFVDGITGRGMQESNGGIESLPSGWKPKDWNRQKVKFGTVSCCIPLGKKERLYKFAISHGVSINSILIGYIEKIIDDK